MAPTSQTCSEAPNLSKPMSPPTPSTAGPGQVIPPCCNRDGLQNACSLPLCHHLRLGLRLGDKPRPHPPSRASRLACCNRDGLQNPSSLPLCHHLRLRLHPKIKSNPAYGLGLQTFQAAWPRDKSSWEATQGLEASCRPTERCLCLVFPSPLFPSIPKLTSAHHPSSLPSCPHTAHLLSSPSTLYPHLPSPLTSLLSPHHAHSCVHLLKK